MRMAWLLAAAVIVAATGLGFSAARYLPRVLQAFGDFLVVREPLSTADTVIAITGDGTGERARTAAALVRAGWASWLIISGSTAGAAPGGATAAMVRDALAAGVQRERMEVDDQAWSTVENARNTAQLMGRRGWRTAILVTSPHHTRRAAWAFRREFHRRGLLVRVIPAERSFFNVHGWWTRRLDRGVVLREYEKLLAYMVGIR